MTTIVTKAVANVIQKTVNSWNFMLFLFMKTINFYTLITKVFIEYN